MCMYVYVRKLGQAIGNLIRSSCPVGAALSCFFKNMPDNIQNKDRA